MPKTTSLLFLLCSFFGYSQSEKLIHGKVMIDKTTLSGIDVVNINTRANATTDKNGNFSILVKVNDTLFIISKEYTDRRITITQKHLNQTNLILYLEKKPIELDDVKITTTNSVKFKVSQGELDAVKIAKQAKALKVSNVYTGEIENGVDFVRMAKGLANLFKNKDKEQSEKPLPALPFREYLAANFDNDFYTKKLKLKPEEVELFISFCEADPKAEIVSKHQDILETTGFLLSKNEAFKKLER